MVEAPQAFMKPYPSRLNQGLWANAYHVCICHKPALWCVEMRKPIFLKIAQAFIVLRQYQKTLP